MCGVCGEVRFDGNPPDVLAVRRMTRAMRHRGPDGEGIWAEGRIAFGHRRLKVLDLSCHAAQPMVDRELGIALVFNGCIYNFADLRDRLATAGYRFASNGDTEVIIKAYHFWGDNFASHLVGMFAIVLADLKRDRVLLIRDRLGIKPLYLSEDRGRLRFASTVQALLRGGQVDTSIDTIALHHHLTWRSIVPAPLTILRGIRKLPPATIQVIDQSGRKYERCYWQPDYARDPACGHMTERDWAGTVRSALELAIQRRMVSDVQVGVLLSGGLDSSLVVALLSRSISGRLRTFSIGFEPARGVSGDEFQWSDEVARQFGTDHKKLLISSRHLTEALPAMVTAMSEPIMSRDTVAFYLLCREVADSVSVVQTGQGADEVFGGYFWHRKFRDDSQAEAAERSALLFVNHEITPSLATHSRCQFDPSADFIKSHLWQSGAESGVDAVLRFDTHVTMVEGPVKRVDNMAMAWGVEARMPFTDQDLVSLAGKCPPELKLYRGGKGILKTIADDLLPADLINRPKGYFPVPALVRLEGDVRCWLSAALKSSAARNRGLLSQESLAKLVDGPQTPAGDRMLWQLGLLEHWLQTHLDTA